MADVFKNAQGVWTNQGVDPADSVSTSADPNAPYERDGVLYQRTPGGHELAIGAAHNDIHDEAHPEVAAQEYLHQLDQSPEGQALGKEQQRQDAIDAIVGQNKAEDLATRQNSPLGKLSAFLTPGKVALGTAAATPFLGPGAALAGGLVNEAATIGRAHYDEPNAEQSLSEAAGGTLEAMSPALLAEAGGAAMKAVPKVAAIASKYAAPIAGTLGTVHGYQRAGIPGAIEEGGLGYLGGKLFGEIPGGTGAFLRKAAGMSAPEAEAAAEAEFATQTAAPGARPGYRSVETPGSSYRPDPAKTPSWEGVEPNERFSPPAPEEYRDFEQPQFGYGPPPPRPYGPLGSPNGPPPVDLRGLGQQQVNDFLAEGRRPLPEGMVVEPARRGTPMNPHTVDRLSVPPSKAGLLQATQAPGEALPQFREPPPPSPFDRYAPNVGSAGGEDIPAAPGERTTFDLPTADAIKEMPLHQQMDYLPTTGEVPQNPKGPTPPYQQKLTPSQQALRRAALADVRPTEIDNPVASRTLNELRTEETPNQKAIRQAQMRRRLQGGGR